MTILRVLSRIMICDEEDLGSRSKACFILCAFLELALEQMSKYLIAFNKPLLLPMI